MSRRGFLHTNKEKMKKRDMKQCPEEGFYIPLEKKPREAIEKASQRMSGYE